MSTDDHLPELPYGGRADPNSGWSGSETSAERAHTRDTDGTTADLQRRTLVWLGRRGSRGATWKELADAAHVHHGSASGVLSVLHKAGRIARLADKRSRCKVYVLPEYVAGRTVEAAGSSSTSTLLGQAIDVLADVPRCEHPWPNADCLSCRAAWVVNAYHNRRGGPGQSGSVTEPEGSK
jgi:hypothetical protein